MDQVGPPVGCRSMRNPAFIRRLSIFDFQFDLRFGIFDLAVSTVLWKIAVS
jgi:hypothetical protein